MATILFAMRLVFSLGFLKIIALSKPIRTHCPQILFARRPKVAPMRRGEFLEFLEAQAAGYDGTFDEWEYDQYPHLQPPGFGSMPQDEVGAIPGKCKAPGLGSGFRSSSGALTLSQDPCSSPQPAGAGRGSHAL